MGRSMCGCRGRGADWAEESQLELFVLRGV